MSAALFAILSLVGGVCSVFSHSVTGGGIPSDLKPDKWLRVKLDRSKMEVFRKLANEVVSRQTDGHEYYDIAGHVEEAVAKVTAFVFLPAYTLS